MDQFAKRSVQAGGQPFVLPQQRVETAGEERAVEALLLLPNRRDGEHRGQRAEYSAQRHRGTKAVTGIIPLHAQVTIELALDEAGQLRQTPLHRAEVPIRSAEEHPSRLKIA